MNDSIYLGTQRVNFTHPAISLDILFDNLTVSHLTNIKPSIFNEKKQILNLTFPHIFAEGEYDMMGNIGDLFDIFGKGHFRGRLIDVSIALTLDFIFNSTSICVPATLDVRIGKVMLNFSHFMGDKDMEKLMNKGFSKILPEIIRVFWEEMKEGNDPSIEEWINSIINRNPAVSSVIEKMIQESSQVS
ncbi:uncharacterized protein [Leptinotarsa decemlineata]|uniref:uncharacterized protein n=1 Tax=Leptinotarsa decemlineata TaxID=7539 RepID=UPI003D30A7AD